MSASALAGWVRCLAAWLLCAVAVVTGLCFVLPFKIRKPQTKEIFLMLIAGVLIAAVLILALAL